MSTLDHKLEPEAKEVRRLEVITGTGRRRQFTEDFKAQVVEETLARLVPSFRHSSPTRAHAAAGVHMAPAGAPAGGG